ncbi:aminoglycoside phosphotransferase family protein [Methylocapsa sp. S129]|uniref:aminoglycoside phosphotransferase family protein n=1 Tax=Methylocapsa sp. S129 TaxID=1641869 RepID=UPI00131E4767|nr:aminoglycoside phosphotransferase family protein [Methylocapsa sp. S129]
MTNPELAGRLANWSLVPDGDLMETRSSWLMPVRQGAILAMLKIFKPASDERDGTDLLRYLDGEAAVRIIEADNDAILMERVNGPLSLVNMATSGADIQAAEILADTVLRLHAPRPRPVPTSLTPLEHQFASLFGRAEDQPLLSRCAAIARRLLASQRDIVPLHGDLHHSNVLDGGARGWLAIDPKALIGERTYETANLLANPWPHAEIVHDTGRMKRLARLYSARLSLDVSRVLEFSLAHAGLSASWDMDDGVDPSYRLECIEALGPLVD